MEFDQSSAMEIERVFAGADRSLLNAMAAAFALVACSDLVLERIESSRFLALARETKQLAILPWAEIEESFKEMTRRLMRDGDEGRNAALQAVANVRGSRDYSAIVLSCARIAVIADLKIGEMEELALSEVAGALGLDPAEA